MYLSSPLSRGKLVDIFPGRNKRVVFAWLRSKEINELYKEFDELYSKDSEFKAFAENYEKEHPIGIKIVDKTGKIIGSNSISKRNKLLSLYFYKHEKGENTTKLYELLIKRGILY